MDSVDILVVDDHPENLVALEGILSRPEYRIIKALSGGEALKHVLKHDFALILLDVMMPRMDGFETAKLVRARDSSRDVPIIFLTANASDVGQIYKAYSVGAVDYLIKPIDPDVVRAKVAVFVDLYRKTQQIKRQELQLREAERARGEHALREQRRQTEERHRFLASASEALLSSLEQAPALDRVAQLIVSAMADWCFIEVTDDGAPPGWCQLVKHGDPARADVVAELARRLTVEPNSDDGDDGSSAENGPLAALLRADSAAAPLENLDEADLRARVGGPALAGLLSRAGCRSLVRVPIALPGNGVGSLSLFSGKPGCYGPEDLDTVSDLAHRIAFAVDNARLYREARRAITLREEFLSIASHELRTPLTPLLLHFQKLMQSERRADNSNPEKLRETLSKCERQLQRMSKLVDSLLDVSRISAGALNLTLDQVDLSEIVKEVLSRFAEEVSRASCTLAVKAEEPVVGSWDRIRVEQLVTNLVANALKYGRGKPVAVTVERDSESALLSVRDHGIGIDPEKLPRIFDRFERAASPTYGGLGLGLYIARQIVSAHGGEIRVSSQPAEGAEFTVLLPLAAAGRQSSQSTESSQSTVDGLQSSSVQTR
jgi:signal transduction histidine kinase/DNA-binding response OmpR family regulator